MSSNWKKLKQQLETNKLIKSDLKVSKSNTSNPSQTTNRSSSKAIPTQSIGYKRKQAESSDNIDKNTVRQATKKRRREISETLALKKQAAIPADANDEAFLEPDGKNNSNSSIPTLKKYKYLISKIIAMDCEMVGIGSSGKQSALARCSIVDFYGNTLYDKIVRPPVLVTDFRTEYSGIRKSDLRMDKAISLIQCQDEVSAILKGKILVGHALKNDLNALLLKHAKTMIRDTATFRPYMRPHPRKAGKFKARALRDLSKEFLEKVIQTGEHDSCEDARAALNLYKLRQDEWEQWLQLQRKSHIDSKSSMIQQSESGDVGEINDQGSTKSKVSLKRKGSIFDVEDVDLSDITNKPQVSIAEADSRAKRQR